MKREILKNYNDAHKISLLFRYADRDDIPLGSFGNEVLLNKKGKQNARNFGENLIDRKINRIFTSPFGRCVQTAEFLVKGYGRSIEIIETTALGAPGLHINDEKIAGEFFLQYGFDEMYQRFMKGEEVPGMTNIDELNYRMTSFLKENSSENGTTIFITHDMLIAFYHFSINKKVYTKDNCMNYMTGLTFINGGIYEK
jgi:broad specificity phosphatase PhoE